MTIIKNDPEHTWTDWMIERFEDGLILTVMVWAACF